MKRQRQTELPRFIVGALATAGASMANGATVQIAFANNVISTVTGLTNFTADLTGDTLDDVEGRVLNGGEEVLVEQLNGTKLGYASFFETALFAGVGANVAFTYTSRGVALAVRGLAPITFTDLNVNGGAPTNGWLEVTATADLPNHQVQIHRLIFDDESTTAPTGVAFTDPAYSEWQVSAVPEASTSLGLLALGAGGILTRRRSKRAA